MRNKSFTTAIQSRRGGASLEYALLAAVIAMTGVLGLAPLGSAIAQEITTLTREYTDATGATAPADTCRRVEWSDAELRHKFSH